MGKVVTFPQMMVSKYIVLHNPIITSQNASSTKFTRNGGSDHPLEVGGGRLFTIRYFSE